MKKKKVMTDMEVMKRMEKMKKMTPMKKMVKANPFAKAPKSKVKTAVGTGTGVRAFFSKMGKKK